MSTVTDLDRVGGRDAVHAVTGDLYDRIRSDEQVARYFVGVDIDRQRQHLTTAVVLLLGGDQDRYADLPHLRERLRAAHRPLGITDADYDVVVAHLVGACTSAGVPDDVLARLGSAAEMVRDDIVA